MYTFVEKYELERRRRELGMSFPVLAKKTGISPATVQRIFARGPERATFRHVAAIASALGLRLQLVSEKTPHELLEAAARRTALRIASMVNGTSGLESQAINDEQKNEMVDQTTHELMSGSKRHVWTAETQ